MKNIKLLSFLILFFLAFGCAKKTYVCRGTDSSGQHTFECKNCWESQSKDYQKQIDDAGYTNVSCAAK